MRSTDAYFCRITKKEGNSPLRKSKFRHTLDKQLNQFILQQLRIQILIISVGAVIKIHMLVVEVIAAVVAHDYADFGLSSHLHLELTFHPNQYAAAA
ncbi:hypothetical protein D3C73_1422590 [compost metagenome]